MKIRKTPIREGRAFVFLEDLSDDFVTSILREATSAWNPRIPEMWEHLKRAASSTSHCKQHHWHPREQEAHKAAST